MSFVRDALFGKPPDANPGMQASAAATERVGLEQVALGREQLQLQRERAAATDALTGRLIDSQVDLSNTQKNIAQSEYDRYQKTYIPIEDRIAREAQAFDTEAERERLAGLAGSDIAGAYKGTAQMGLRSQARFGLRPNANALAAIDSQLRAQQAGQMAGAMTNARYAARDTGTQRLMNAVGVGKGLTTTATTAATGATGGYSSAANMQFGANNSYNQGASNALNFSNSGVNALGSAGGQYGAISNYNLKSYDIQSQQMAAMLNAAGAVAGGGMKKPPSGGGGNFGYGVFADGGPIQDPKGLLRGPGTETSDSIPAMLSKGEYVIPADVVKAKGIEFFNKLLDKHHTPAEIQEARKLYADKNQFGIRRT
jgi:hypothetical protein